MSEKLNCHRALSAKLLAVSNRTCSKSEEILGSARTDRVYKNRQSHEMGSFTGIPVICPLTGQRGSSF